MAFKYNNAKGQTYYLHSKMVKLRSHRDQLIYYFARDIRPEAIDMVPEGFTVVENPKTGMPTLKKNK